MCRKRKKEKGERKEQQVIFYNINGFWNGIIDFLAGLERQHFAHHPLNSYFAVANDLRELTELLK